MGKPRNRHRRIRTKTGSSKNNNEDNEDNTIEHYTSFKNSLDECSLELIQDAYRQQGSMFKRFDPQASREKMADFLLKTTYLDFPLAKPYMNAAARELKEMGGMQLISIVTKAKKETESFIYTKGFTDLGGPEFLMQNVHRSIFNKVADMLNYMYKARKERVIYKENQTINLGNVILKFQRPSANDALVLKATRMLETLSYYGLNGFDVLYIVPIAVQIEKFRENAPDKNTIAAFQTLFPNDKIDRSAMDSHFPSQKSMLKRLHKGEKDVPGFIRVDSRELRMCEFCTTTDQELEEDDEDARLKNCVGCKTAVYCSRSCQKNHWKKHKAQCAKWQELKKKKDTQGSDDEECEIVSLFLKKYSKEIDWDGYQPEKKERMKSEEGQKEHIRDAMKTAKEAHKLFAKESSAGSM
mmetsp:Transcript_3598/g.5487  ORF Transcript_3598/g.5487 Transcript_3598/m.5487 type:complete len:411 (+) Transcript_3598:149-1381(+)